jgi:hypothetical protein
VTYWVYLDIDGDEVADYAVINRDNTLTNITDGRQVTWAVNLESGAATAFFFAEHSTNTGNTVLYVCAEQVGLSEADLLSTPVGIGWEAQDFYYGGPGDLLGTVIEMDGDAIVGDFVVTPFGERFVANSLEIGPNAGGTLGVLDFGPFGLNTDELGLMLVTNGDRGAGARGGATEATESILLTLAP